MAVDSEQFQHALHNLLDNALAHTPQGGRITLAAKPAGDKIVFSVTDTGVGHPRPISAAGLREVFPRARRRGPQRQRAGAGDRARDRHRPRRRRRVRKQPGREDRLSPHAAGVERPAPEATLQQG